MHFCARKIARTRTFDTAPDGGAHVQFCEQRWGRFPSLTHLIIHGASQAQAEELLEQVSKRLGACQLRVNKTKTQLVYCKDNQRKGVHQQVSFAFLGYSVYPIRFRSQLDGRVR